MFGVFVGVKRVFRANHLLVQFFAGADADGFLRAFGGDGGGQIANVHGRDFFHINFAAHHVVKRVPHEFHALFQRNHEAGHARVGNRQRAACALGEEKWDDRSARAHHVAVAHHGEAAAVFAGIGVAGHEEFVAGELGGAV